MIHFQGLETAHLVNLTQSKIGIIKRTMSRVERRARAVSVVMTGSGGPPPVKPKLICRSGHYRTISLGFFHNYRVLLEPRRAIPDRELDPL